MTYFTSPALTDWQHQIILGTVLGGSSIVKPTRGRNCYLFMRSSNARWLAYKAEEFKGFCSQQPFTREGRTQRWHSNCFPIFNEYRDLFYKDKDKQVNMQILDQLRDIGLAIWYGDSGKIKSNCVLLNTHKYGQEGTELICRYFKEVGIEAELKMEKNSIKTHLSPSGSKKFLATIAHRLPEFIR